MMDENTPTLMQNGDDNDFYKQVADLLAASRKYAKRQMDNTIAITYYEIGRMIVEREQRGEKRAQYGAKLIKGYSPISLFESGQKQQILSAKSEDSEKSYSLISFFEKSPKGQMISDQFKLTWTHYQILMRVKDEDARRFYEIEAVSGQWSVRQLQRQVGSSLYERLALSRDREKVMALSSEGQNVESPHDLFKTPYIFEFTGLEEHSSYSETELERALIDNMQKFLLELGKGFLFESRQKRFTFDEDSFYLDLVTYNRLLQCYVIIDLKIGKIKHQDLGQMLMYVNYFDRYVKKDFEKPTIGILICEDKKDRIVELTLPENANIFASEYSLYLPDKTLIQNKLAQWIEEFEDTREQHKFTNGSIDE